jgi:hypothetical protein
VPYQIVASVGVQDGARESATEELARGVCSGSGPRQHGRVTHLMG